MAENLFFESLDEAQYYFSKQHLKELTNEDLVMTMFTAKAVYENLNRRTYPSIIKNFWYTLQKACEEHLKSRKLSIATLSKDKYQLIIGIVGLVEMSAESETLVEIIRQMSTKDLLECVEGSQANDNNSRILLDLMSEEIERRAVIN